MTGVQTCALPIYPDGYAPGHFARVYSHAIRPVLLDAGYQPIRGDDVAATNFIVVDVIQRLINSPMAICDLSARNPNVLFELGLRQAFDMPVVLIKDVKTERVFDISGLRTIDYDETLRVDCVSDFQSRLRSAISETRDAPADSVNSLVRLLGIQKAHLKAAPKLSQDTALLLSAIRDLGGRLEKVESNQRNSVAAPESTLQSP